MVEFSSIRPEWFKPWSIAEQCEDSPMVSEIRRKYEALARGELNGPVEPVGAGIAAATQLKENWSGAFNRAPVRRRKPIALFTRSTLGRRWA